MLSVEQARAAHAAARDAFTSNPTAAYQKALTAAAEALAQAEAERARQAEAGRLEREQAFAAWQATDLERQQTIEGLVAGLVAIEKEAFERVAKIRTIVAARQADYHHGKQLSLSLDRSEILKPPPTIQSHGGDVGRAIRDARARVGRGNAEHVGDWLQPAPAVYTYRTPAEPTPR